MVGCHRHHHPQADPRARANKAIVWDEVVTYFDGHPMYVPHKGGRRGVHVGSTWYDIPSFDSYFWQEIHEYA